MTKKKLRTRGQGGPLASQHTTPCSDCPWRRDSLAGWLGGAGIMDWLETARGDAPVPCHVHADQQCAGIAIYRANTAKIPRDGLVLPADKATCFGAPREFMEHHYSAASQVRGQAPARAGRRQAASPLEQAADALLAYIRKAVADAATPEVPERLLLEVFCERVSEALEGWKMRLEELDGEEEGELEE